MTTKICNHCGLEKDEEEYNRRYKVLGIRNPACRDCQHGFNKTFNEGDARQRHVFFVADQVPEPILSANLSKVINDVIFGVGQVSPIYNTWDDLLNTLAK